MVRIGDIIKIAEKKTKDQRYCRDQLYDVIMTSPVGGAFFNARNGDICYVAPEEFVPTGLSYSMFLSFE